MSENFNLAPPAKIVDTLPAVPIDIQTINAEMAFDGVSSSCSVDATIDFVVGGQDGCPIFDLRQVINAAWLDGSPIAVSKLAHHNFGGGTGAELTVLNKTLAAGSNHSLRLTYNLAAPIGTSTPPMVWSAGPRLVFRFAFDDLNPARYLEKWLPANLIFDQFELNLIIKIENTTIPHTAISNGTVTTSSTNHFSITFPASFTALSHLLELRPTDSLSGIVDTVALPVSGKTVTIEAWKLASSSTNLAAQINNIKTWLTNNENSSGPYIHGNRFVAFINTGGMEYDGGITTGVGALKHEVYHSWWGRGVKPASAPHGWWDEAWTVYNDYGASGAVPFDYGDPSVELCPRNPWVRVTNTQAYSKGRDFFDGVAALLGVTTLVSIMKDFFSMHNKRPTTTEAIEAHLVAQSGKVNLVDAFHRFVYGFPDPVPAPSLWLKDHELHTGSDSWGGTFWDSPDLWVRNTDDGGLDHQNPAAGQDNWFYARVRSMESAGTARHFLVSFNVKSFAGTQFVYPDDFLPSNTAAVGFDLEPGEMTIVKARWPAQTVPPHGSHVCLLAAVITRAEHPSANRHVWEHNNLAQKNLTIVELPAGNWLTVPFVVANLNRQRIEEFNLQLNRRKGAERLDARLLFKKRDPIEIDEKPDSASILPELSGEQTGTFLECGDRTRIKPIPKPGYWTSLNPNAYIARSFTNVEEVAFAAGANPSIPLEIKPGEQHLVGLKIYVPEDHDVKEVINVDLVKRDRRTERILGGIAVQIEVINQTKGEQTMKPERKLFTDGNQYLLQIDATAEVITNAEPTKNRVRGEIILGIRGDHPEVVGVNVSRFGISGSSVAGSRGDTGTITVVGSGADGAITFGKKSTQLNAQFDCKINYESLDEARVPEKDKGCYYLPAFEPAATTIRGELEQVEGKLVISNLELSVVCVADDFGEIKLIKISEDQVPLQALLPAPNTTAALNRAVGSDIDANNAACDPSLNVNKRKLICQPVGFKSSATDASPSGGTSAAQFATAQTVWAKSCIEIEVKPITYIVNSTLKTSSNLTNIRAAYTHSDTNVIEVFFVDNLLPLIGGGSAGAIGVASCKVVMAEPNAGNPVLLAHELGHVLGLLHPSGTSNPSDPGTVISPTGSASNPGTELVTHSMATNISNPVLQTLTTTCCLTHDKGNHYLRDFPVDVGAEPSDPLPAGMTRYSMSNVWNRRSNTPGTWNATTGPEHEHPARFQTDGTTPFTNYLYARIEQLVNLKVRNAKVKFYLKHPGSGGGAVNLQLLGEVSVPNTLAVGSPQTVNLSWTVPAGTPNHSCVFAVVHSPSEPEGNQSGLNWWQFENLSRQDNDWAQRNLDLINTSSNSGNVGSGNVASAPFIIRIPPELDYERLPLILNVDASSAEGLESLALEIPGHERIEVSPGTLQAYTPKTPLVPAKDFIIVVQAVIPAGAPRQRSFVVNIDPVVNKIPFAGFSCDFRLSKTRDVIAQVLDEMMAAFTDLASAMDTDFAYKLEKAGLSIMRDRPFTLRELADATLEFIETFEAGVEITKGLVQSKEYDFAGAVARMRDIGAQYHDGAETPLGVVEAFRDVFQRLGMIASVLKDHPMDTLPGTVRVVVDRLEILYDHDIFGPGECYFTAEVEDGGGKKNVTRFPKSGYYCIDAGCRAANVQLDCTIYEGAPGKFLKIVFNGYELDCLTPDDKFTRYERTFKGDPTSFVGSYAPEKGGESRESMPDWRVFYRII